MGVICDRDAIVDISQEIYEVEKELRNTEKKNKQLRTEFGDSDRGDL